MVLAADEIAAITHIVASTMAAMPMQQQATAAQEPRARRLPTRTGRAALSEDPLLQRRWLEGLLVPVQGGNEEFARGGF